MESHSGLGRTEPHPSTKAPHSHPPLHKDPLPSHPPRKTPPTLDFSEQPTDSFALTVFAETLFLHYSAKSTARLRSREKPYLKIAFPRRDFLSGGSGARPGLQTRNRSVVKSLLTHDGGRLFVQVFKGHFAHLSPCSPKPYFWCHFNRFCVHFQYLFNSQFD